MQLAPAGARTIRAASDHSRHRRPHEYAAGLCGSFSSRRAHLRGVRIWLVIVAAMIVAMILVGGATRLTESGLSIVEWKPVTGAIPPLSAQAWT